MEITKDRNGVIEAAAPPIPQKTRNDGSRTWGTGPRYQTRAHLLGTSTSTLIRLRCASDRGQHLLPYQATEWSDQHPIRAKASPCRDVRAQYSSLGPQLCGAVRPYTHFEVPCRLRGSRRGGCTELNWAGCAQFSTGTPKATNCAEHEFFAGPLLKQSETFREHAVLRKVTRGTGSAPTEMRIGSLTNRV